MELFSQEIRSLVARDEQEYEIRRIENGKCVLGFSQPNATVRRGQELPHS
jgi:hypothetical protein